MIPINFNNKLRDIYDVKEEFKRFYPNEKASFSFDDKCIRHIDITFTDGLINPTAHVQYCKVKINMSGDKEYYIDIKPHRESISLKTIEEKLSNMKVLFDMSQIDYLLDLQKIGTGYAEKLDELSKSSGNSVSEIKEMMKKRKTQ